MTLMPTSTQKQPSNLQENDGGYGEFLRGLDLVWVGLKGCSVFIDRDGLSKLFSEKKRSVRRFSDTYAVRGLGPNFFEASGSFIVTIQESPEAKPVLTVECEFDAHLHGPEPISKGFVERFVASDFQLILVPYARQFVSTTTAQMGIPPLVIPLSIASQTKHSGKDKSPTKKTARAHAKTR
jgi:hypothetical protein